MIFLCLPDDHHLLQILKTALVGQIAVINAAGHCPSHAFTLFRDLSRQLRQRLLSSLSAAAGQCSGSAE